MKATKPTFTHASSSFNTSSSSGTTTPSIVLPPELVQLFPTTASPTPTTPLQPTLIPPADLTSLDLSLPLSTLLKSGTKIAHADAEHSPGAIALATGTLELTEYVRYLTMLWVVYQELERQLDEVVKGYTATAGTTGDGSVDALIDIWSDTKGKGSMLRRSPGLALDIQYYLSYLSIPLPTTPPPLPSIPFPTPSFLLPILTSPPPDLSSFTTHLVSLTTGPRATPGRLLAHAYVRYLGDLSGGQLVASKIRRVYGLPPPPGGTSFYEFDLDERGEAGVSVTKEGGKGERGAEGGDTLYERKKKVERIKDWFRDCMDGNVGDDEALKAELIQEAIISFKLSTRIFSMLEPPAPKSSDVTTDGAHSNPMTHLSQRRPAHHSSAVDSKPKPTTTSTSTTDEKSKTKTPEQQRADLENPPLTGRSELYLKIGMAVFVLVAYKIMSHLMLEEGEGLDRAGSRLAKFLGRE